MFNFSHGGWLIVIIISVLGALFVGLPTVIGGNIDRTRARNCAQTCSPYVSHMIETPGQPEKSCMCWDGKGWQQVVEAKEEKK
jgi:hypothetical protein